METIEIKQATKEGWIKCDVGGMSYHTDLWRRWTYAENFGDN